MVTTTTTSTITSDTTNTFINPLPPTEHKDILSNTSFANQQQHPQPSKQDIINNLIELAKQEQAKGNTSITSDKLDKLQSILQNKTNNRTLSPKSSYNFDKFQQFKQVPTTKEASPRVKPKYPPIFDKFDIDKTVSKQESLSEKDLTASRSTKKSKKRGGKFFQAKKFTFKQLEFMFINFLETIANLLDNLHLLSNMPMFPQVLTKLLKQTNKLWVLILVFLIRKTISQLLNVIRKIRKVHIELNIVNNSSKSELSKPVNEDINRKYNKILKDLKFDKMMLIFELVGNFLDLVFNLIELSEINVPNWIMSGLNVASMGMTIYRMNKDDEYIDDDITEDLI
ncbi:hypothetical protein CORT_0D05600 [Candida orthopsilosis Co 90-125]|uniref:Uncharacterized protein n=1 Tax=Candida orthopsilosis (strain 90-125) TaxID=1136231 RepID=H8X5E3_CANO9|nr:hypothetical protein CORT_0D05600 [Candida orthopsilosis Co 90-125]CCG23399.1 hypothetical protein CORT_0D05600 [Candida orthopsilosis Co 90-125]